MYLSAQIQIKFAKTERCSSDIPCSASPLLQDVVGHIVMKSDRSFLKFTCMFHIKFTLLVDKFNHTYTQAMIGLEQLRLCT